MKKILAITAIVLILSGCGDKQKVERPALEIPVYTTKLESVPIYEEYIGQIYGSEDISIRARIEGFVQHVHFREGELVEAGDKLYTLESNSQNANVAEKQSRLAQAQTHLSRAKSDLARIKPLAAMNAVSKSDLDGAQADYDAALSSVAAANASLSSSRVTQGYTIISSPITGVIGKSNFRTGDLVGSAQDNMILTEVSSVDSVRVQFFISENLYLQGFRRIAKRQEAEGKNRSKASKQALTLILSDGSEYSEKGYLDFIDRSIDPTTGAILLQATFPNPKGMLRPGLFAKIRVKIRDVKDGILVPQRSVTELQELSQVAVVDEKGIVTMRSITAGNKVGNFWLVEDGLKAGEKVVYEGLQKVRDGLTVIPVDTIVTFIDGTLPKQPIAPKKDDSESKENEAK